MKLTDRDQKLLRFLAVFLLAVGFTYFILLPGIEKSEDLSQKISDRELQKSEMDMKLALLPQMQKTNEEMIQRREEAAGLFLPRMSSQRIDRMLLEMLQACGLEAMNMNISISEEAFTLEPFPGSALAQEQAVSGGSAGGTETTDGTEAANASQETKFSAEQLRSAKVDLTVAGEENACRQLLDQFCENTPAFRVVQYSRSRKMINGQDSGFVQLNVSLELLMIQE